MQSACAGFPSEYRNRVIGMHQTIPYAIGHRMFSLVIHRNVLLCIFFACFMWLLAMPHISRGAPLPIADREISRTDSLVSVSFHYPVFGIQLVDADLKDWAEHNVDVFVSDIAGFEHNLPYELRGTYEIICASDRVVSVVWHIWSFSGGVHGNLDIAVFVYDTATWQTLDLQNLFVDEQGALNIFSRTTYQTLSETLETVHYDKELVRYGTTPDLDNFACVAPTQDGVRVFFPPYQVAPWAAGPREVDIPLSDLAEAGPRMEYWTDWKQRPGVSGDREQSAYSRR